MDGRPDAEAGPAWSPQEAVRALARVARLLERASGELSLAHYRVLSAVAAGEERASRVAERLELGRPAISAAVDTLCRAGLVVRAEVPGDQRAIELRVSREGYAALARVETAMVRALEEVTASMPDGEAVLRALAALGPGVDALSAARHARRREATS